MPRVRLAQGTIRELAAPDPSGRPTLYFDTELKGFGVLVSGKTATKTYVVQRDLPGGKTRRVTVAAVNELPLPDARKKAAGLLLKMRDGVDPKAERKAAEDAKQAEAERQTTLRAVSIAFLEARPHLRPKSRIAYADGLRFFDEWLDKPLRSITREMVETRHKEIAREIVERARLKQMAKGGEAKPPKNSGASSANGAMRTLRALWNFAAEKHADLPPNPVRLRRQWFPEPRREGHVPANQLAKFYKAVQGLPNDVQRDFLVMVLFTGLRRNEAASLTWDDIDLDAKTLTIPGSRTKPGRTLKLPLSDIVFDMLKARRALGKTRFVFPSKGATGYIAEPKFPLSEVARACGIRVSCHDLRRTFLTVAESVGLDGYTLKALANHALGNTDVTGGYLQISVERLRDPVQRVAERMKRLCGIDGGAIIELRQTS